MKNLLIRLHNKNNFINNNMELEDSRNALYCDPNAYIQGIKKPESKKVVFQQPYETMPNFYLNNNFKKHNCNYGCEKCKEPPKDEKCSCNKKSGFDLKNLMPMLGLIGGGNSKLDLSNIANILGNGLNTNGFIGSLLGNKDMISNIIKIFSNTTESAKTTKEVDKTDFEIKNYTRVD